MTTFPALSLQAVSKSFGDTAVLRAVDLDVRRGAFVSLLGPSGCGKSTLLRIVAGLEAQTEGTVAIDGEGIDHLPPKARDIAMVFQSYALYPHMTVAENIAMPLVMGLMGTGQRLPLVGRYWPGHRGIQATITERVHSVARLTEIAALLARRPSQLSGGQRQRVALARAIVREPRLMLMDEPLSNLDAKLRLTMRSELVALNKRLGATVLYVTHDQVEAMTMSDRIALMMGGHILQHATPADIYRSPAHRDVATFIGQPSINLLDARSNAVGGLLVPAAENSVLITLPNQSGLSLGVRPEALFLAKPDSEPALRFRARLDRTELLGPEVLAWCCIGDRNHRVAVQMRAAEFESARAAGRLNDRFFLDAGIHGVHVFAAEGQVLPLRTVPAAQRPNLTVTS